MSQEWKIYTRKGDKGETSLLGGTRVSKDHPRIEAYGTLDELNAFVGFLRDNISDPRQKDVLLRVMNLLFVAESRLAADTEESLAWLPLISEDEVVLLEREIDFMNESLPALNNFILPGGHPSVSAAHIARTVCRRAERLVISLGSSHTVEEVIVRYLNRLSDYLFVLARKLSADTQCSEIIWKAEINNK